MNNSKRKKSFYLKVSKLYLLISLLFFILNITYVFATTNKETQTYTSSSRAYKPHNEGEEKQVDWGKILILGIKFMILIINKFHKDILKKAATKITNKLIGIMIKL